MTDRCSRPRHDVTPVVAALTCLCIIAWGVASVRSQPSRSIWDGVYTNEQAARGESLYQNGCAECHGAALEGDELAPPLVGGEFMWAWNSLSLGDLFERLRISMPEANPSAMSRTEKADVLAFILSKNEVPPGEAEIADRAGRLRAISFDAVKP